jgi:alpha-mannosidase
VSKSSIERIRTSTSRFKIEGADGIILDTIKRGEDRGIVLRMYESLGGRARGKLHLYVLLMYFLAQADGSSRRVPVKSLRWVNILEEDTDEEICWVSEGDCTTVQLDLRGFEIRTLMIE